MCPKHPEVVTVQETCVGLCNWAFDTEAHFLQQELNSQEGWHVCLECIKKKMRALFKCCWALILPRHTGKSVGIALCSLKALRLLSVKQIQILQKEGGISYSTGSLCLFLFPVPLVFLSGICFEDLSIFNSCTFSKLKIMPLPGAGLFSI